MDLKDLKIIQLCVGGVKYTTTRDTLMKYDGFLSVLLSDKFAVTLIDDAIFIDRNGELFAHILDFLRNGVLPKYDAYMISRLKLEADFYQIAPLIEILTVNELELVCFNVSGKRFSIEKRILLTTHFIECGILDEIAVFNDVIHWLKTNQVSDNLDIVGDCLYFDRSPKYFDIYLHILRDCSFDILSDLDPYKLDHMEEDLEWYFGNAYLNNISKKSKTGNLYEFIEENFCKIYDEIHACRNEISLLKNAIHACRNEISLLENAIHACRNEISLLKNYNHSINADIYYIKK